MYSFEPSDEQKILIDAARKFAAKELRTRLREGDERSLPFSALDYVNPRPGAEFRSFCIDPA